MKQIRKQQPPNNFTEWKAKTKAEKTNYSYDNLQNPEKRNIHESLLQEQGYICCYCCGRITLERSHIEHLKAQVDYPELALDYQNMLASCGSVKRFPEYCGNHKGDRELPITPLQYRCEEYFEFLKDGRIRSRKTNLKQEEETEKTEAEKTIEILNLNHPEIQDGRVEVFEWIKENFKRAKSAKEKQTLAKKYEKYLQLNNGRYRENWDVVNFHLKRYLR
ncbi:MULTISPECIES: retron system putative HNH endonuclease [Spirulina sp. CCY15215]|uniref:retron system putative HNH endonuclease n=1 Tax=Spirulina sp. CCY15215 TaxID=2767591 RepID=UPI001951C429|nr:retron system putative HNH endonuclease [Spirulina major]